MSGDRFYFDIDAQGLEVLLGPTEARLMEIAWRTAEVTVKQALFELGGHALAYTTVMTVLNRLTAKGLLDRRRDGRNFVYSPTVSREDFVKERADRIVGCLHKNFPELKLPPPIG